MTRRDYTYAETVDIERLEPAAIDLALAGRLATVQVAAMESVPTRRPTGQGLLLQLDDTEARHDALFLAREAGELVGWALTIEPEHEYLDTTFISGAVTPARQGRGIGRSLLDEVRARSARGRLRARAWQGTAGADALPALGFTPTLTHGVRRLALTDVDQTWAERRAEAERGSADYELSYRVGPTPPAELAEMVMLREVINDAPDALEWEAYPAERIAAYEQSLITQQQTQYSIVARHLATSETAGLTMVCVHELTPEVAAQEDTSVVRVHRGHQLGLRLKIAMADWLRAERPDVHAVDTWNDTTNAPVLAVNERLGTSVVALNTVFVRSR